MAGKILNGFFVTCFLAVIFVSGCETAKGAAKGVGAVAVGTAEGAKKDWQAVKKADGWMRKNMW